MQRVKGAEKDWTGQSAVRPANRRDFNRFAHYFGDVTIGRSTDESSCVGPFPPALYFGRRWRALLLDASANSIRGTLEALPRGQAAQGLSLREDWVRTVKLTDSFPAQANSASRADNAVSQSPPWRKAER